MKTGKVTENVFRRSILQPIKTKRQEVINGAGPGEDCAVFSLSDGELVTCGQDGAVSLFPVEILLQKCVNIQAARGAVPVAAALEILLPQDAEEQQLKAVMQAAEEFCSQQRMQIARVAARVTDSVREIYVVVTVYGHAQQEHTLWAAEPEQDILISKWIGLEGTVVLADRYRERISERYPGWLSEEAAAFRRYLSTVPEAAVALKSGVCAMHNLSEGGVFAGLWELAESAGVGLNIDLKKLPVRQETVEICNHLNVNPYELLSGGSLLMTTRDGAALLAALEEAGIPAVMVGRTTDGNDRIIRNEDEVRYLDRPREDSIYHKLSGGNEE